LKASQKKLRCFADRQKIYPDRRLRTAGLNYIILDKTTPLWKRIGEPPEIQIGCYRGDPG